MFKISIIVGPRYNVFEALTFFLLTSYKLFDCVNGQEEFLVEFIFNQPSINKLNVSSLSDTIFETNSWYAVLSPQRTHRNTAQKLRHDGRQ